MRQLKLFLCAVILLNVVVLQPAVPSFAAPAAAARLDVQKFLSNHPGSLKTHRDGKYTAAQAIEAYTSYYNLNPRIILTLLELEPKLLSDRNPPAERINKPFGDAGPSGFNAQIDWAVREIRAGFGPYDSPPTVRFSDGSTTTLDIQQDPSVVAVERFLVQGHTQDQWRALVDAYEPLYETLWGSEPATPAPSPAATEPFLRLPWPAGIDVIHSSYFDHVYPTVDRGGDDNNFIVDYRGRGNLSYNTHDGHDYYFPAQPIGTPMLAAAPGMAYAYTTRGNGVVIRHSGANAGYETVYWHLDQFAAIFRGKIDNGAGVPVEAGTVLGTSGKTGFTDGGAHLHFEVRHNGKQVDPYGWYGPGPDPCLAWTAGCGRSVWLWHESLNGSYDFTRPDAPAPRDTEPPVGSLAVAPDSDLGLLAHFDNTILPTIGRGFPQVNGSGGGKLRFGEGVWDQALEVTSNVEASFPISGNLELERGTIAFWAKLPAEYPSNSTKRHYLFAASANAEDGKVYSDTLALRRERTDDGAAWNFWTVDSSGESHNLFATDTLTDQNWHHIAVAWSKDGGSKTLYIDGAVAAQANGVTLPAALGERLQLGRFIANFGVSGATIDEFAVFKRALSSREIGRLAEREDPYTQASGPIRIATSVTDRKVVLDANAIDAQGGIVSVELRRNDGPWSEPLPYHDNFRWSIEGDEGTHSFAVRYRDRADNTTIVTTTLELRSPLVGDAAVQSHTDTAAVLDLHVGGETNADQAEMQLSTHEDFRDAVWEPFNAWRVWHWEQGEDRRVFVRFRDRQGRISIPQQVGPDVATP